MKIEARLFCEINKSCHNHVTSERFPSWKAIHSFPTGFKHTPGSGLQMITLKSGHVSTTTSSVVGLFLLIPYRKPYTWKHETLLSAAEAVKHKDTRFMSQIPYNSSVSVWAELLQRPAARLCSGPSCLDTGVFLLMYFKQPAVLKHPNPPKWRNLYKLLTV